MCLSNGGLYSVCPGDVAEHCDEHNLGLYKEHFTQKLPRNATSVARHVKNTTR